MFGSDRGGRSGTGERSGSAPADADETAVLPRAGRTRGGLTVSLTGADETAPLPTQRDSRTGTDADPTEVLSASGTAGPAGSFRDPWADSPGLGGDSAAGSGDATHDPHEVTVQLDAVQLGDTRLRPAAGSPHGGQDGSDGPVFVDESGRRSRRFRRLGMAVGTACAVYAVVIVATLLSGSSDAPWLPVPGQNGDKPASQVDSPPLPAQSATPSGSASASPGPTPTTSDGTTPSAGAPASATGTGSKPGTAADPKPSASKTTPGTGAGPGTSTDPKPPSSDPSTPASSGPSTPVDTDPSPDPSESSASGGTGPLNGTGSVADGPSSTTPIAEEPGDPALSATDLSPEHTL
ncbi:hypothetical protein [Streptomyces brasiliensis]|uniref:Uncharacterized protein n=1 Tax=Streptomyces brasiliensis TaxID=1954 RepID=A0A917KKU1_9ACTN|nr:hypothetical protein [Streptomyces brasiliensis]GGJ18393.1 hypothetical protein GCM10010121_031710 [Streptomyces brasiliensis]